jgi:hypothetical protein
MNFNMGCNIGEVIWNFPTFKLNKVLLIIEKCKEKVEYGNDFYIHRINVIAGMSSPRGGRGIVESTGINIVVTNIVTVDCV